MKWIIPNVLTSARLVLAIPFSIALERYHLMWALLLLSAACLTDVIDGWVARRLKVGSSVGAYFDAVADFVFIATGFVIFVQQGVYPTWTPVVLVLMFAQFVLSSRLQSPIYDPIGKYYGAFLYATLFLLLLLPDLIFSYAILSGLVVMSGLSLSSRIMSLTGVLRSR